MVGPLGEARVELGERSFVVAASAFGYAAKKYSQADTSCWPGLPPSASTVVPGSSARAKRLIAGSRRKTADPAGTSTSSPSSSKVARPEMTTYISSCPSRSSLCSSTTSCPASVAV